MPQLIAMIIIVVGAMIYMFQTFGGTGDKIEGIAQKASVITEVNNIKNGLKLAARAGDVKVGTTLQDLAKLGYFPEQVNEQITKATGNNVNTYNAISFGGQTDQGNPAMQVLLVANTKDMVPGIFVKFPKNGSLGSSGGFLESQVANDLKSIAMIHRSAKVGTDNVTTAANTVAQNSNGTGIEKRTPKVGTATTTKNDAGENVTTYVDTADNDDGEFIIYFNDFGSNEVIK
ncbi:hypothetical protein AFAEC_2165 [Aliarcobacter faecis]|uniref:hypothetical protein n=1 Tax=Aliarcobacter faecis TaxID=1564138 RepID=UPI00047C04A0|nr:hypothetical protein [Aliarcobacter faecis]QKF74309.1 hypothetical protein AFAEC_2165 [Aliarcobacter faecis]